MATIKNLEDLTAWVEAKKLCVGIYEITKFFPLAEKYNVTKHLRESGRGVMGNLAEGFGRYFFKESMQFYDVALGCLEEIRSDIHLSFSLGYINQTIFNKFTNQINKIRSKTNGLISQTKL